MAIPEKFRKLTEDFIYAPSKSAPENSDRLHKICDNLGIEIRLTDSDSSWKFEELRCFGEPKIMITLRTLERLWAYTYAMLTIVSEIQKCGVGLKPLENPREFRKASDILDWAEQLTFTDIELPWPDNLIDPTQGGKNEYVINSNNLYLMLCGRLLLHEIAHTHHDHTTDIDTPPNILFSQEHEADQWADEWLLANWQQYSENELVYMQRSVSIAAAYLIPLLVGYRDKKKSSKTHPSPIARIKLFAEKHYPNAISSYSNDHNLPCVFILIILNLLIDRRGEIPPQLRVEPDTFSEYFDFYEPYFS